MLERSPRGRPETSITTPTQAGPEIGSTLRELTEGADVRTCIGRAVQPLERPRQAPCWARTAPGTHRPTDRIIPVRGFTRCGPGGRPEVTDAELVCIAVGQVLLRFDDERHRVRIAPRLIGHLFPRLRRQSELQHPAAAARAADEAAAAPDPAPPSCRRVQGELARLRCWPRR